MSSTSLCFFSSFVPGQMSLLVKSSPVSTVSFVPVNPTSVRRGVTLSSVETNKAPGPRGIMKPRRISPEMQAFLGGVLEIPRTQVLKEIWSYIKQHNLQDPADKKIIVCDEKLKQIFAGRDRIGFLEIAGLINPHFLK